MNDIGSLKIFRTCSIPMHFRHHFFLYQSVIQQVKAKIDEYDQHMTSPSHAIQSHSTMHNLIIPAIALLICAGMTVVFWPGVATWEVIQFEFQRNLPVMNDWKSPFVAYIYWIADYLFDSTGPVLLAQQILFWAGLALVAQNTFSNLIQRTVFVLVVASLPLVWISQILLWKEAWTMSLLMMSLGAVFAYLNTGKPSIALVGVLGGILLTLTRQNALLLALPTCYVGAQFFTAKISRGKPEKQRGKHCQSADQDRLPKWNETHPSQDEVDQSQERHYRYNCRQNAFVVWRTRRSFHEMLHAIPRQGCAGECTQKIHSRGHTQQPCSWDDSTKQRIERRAVSKTKQGGD